MHYRLIKQRPDNRRVICIFLGWAMDAAPFENTAVCKDGFDTAVFYHYTSLEQARKVFDNIVSLYDEAWVIAWSYGVAVADIVTDNNKVISRIALNGTPVPVDNTRGIPPRYHNLTLRMLSAENLAKFYNSTGMPGGKFPDRTLDDLKAELQFFGAIPTETVKCCWKKAYISSKDAIFPPANQLKAWEGITRIEEVPDGQHYIDFGPIIANDIIDKELIARRFTQNAARYDSHASVQKAIAVRLTELWTAIRNLSGIKVLELGIGTGFLTRRYSSLGISNLSVAVDLVDSAVLADIHRKSGLDYPGTLVCDDAERFIDTLPDNSFDAVVSASTIQWFNDLPRFFNNVSRVLKPGGVAAIATFAQGTYAELKEASGRSLTYPTADYFKSVMPKSLTIQDLVTDEIKMEFADSRQLLGHIRETGVNAVGSPTLPGQTRRMLSYFDSNPHLTYRPLYMTLIKQ